jgi:hypothetical protein
MEVQQSLAIQQLQVPEEQPVLLANLDPALLPLQDYRKQPLIHLLFMLPTLWATDLHLLLPTA